MFNQEIKTAYLVSRYVSWLHGVDFFSYNSNFSYDEETLRWIDKVFDAIKDLKPLKDNIKELWLRIPRGTFEEYMDMHDMSDYTEEELRASWKYDFPDEEAWFNFVAVHDDYSDCRAISIGQKTVIYHDPHKEVLYPNDIHYFVKWIYEAVCQAMKEIRNGTYNEYVKNNLPVQHRTGTIQSKDWWDVFPESREEFFKDFPISEREEILDLIAKQPKDSHDMPRVMQMTANDFYTYCSWGYAANKYRGTELSPKEQYYIHADGRDDGLKEVDGDDTEAYRLWVTERERTGGHPWEVCAGGNSTHIALHTMWDRNGGGYRITLAGSAWNRTVETLKFYRALHKHGIPVYLYEADELAARVQETEKIGILPEGIFPAYASSFFHDEDHVIDFRNLPYEEKDIIASKCTWYDEPQAELLTERKMKTTQENE